MRSQPVSIEHLRAVTERLALRGERDSSNADDVVRRLVCPGLFTESEVAELIAEVTNGASNILEYVLAKSERVRDPTNGEALYRVKDDTRRKIVSESGLSVMSDSGHRKVDARFDGLETLLSQLVYGATLGVDTVASFGVETALRATSILRPVLQHRLPTEQMLRSFARISRQKSWMNDSLERVFINREKEYERLRNFLLETVDEEADGAIMEVRGAAGVGKTTLVRRAITNAYTQRRSVVIYLDFERPVSNDGILNFFFSSLLQALFDEGHISESAFLDWSRQISSMSQPKDMTEMLTRLRSVSRYPDSPWLMFFDSAEVFLNAFGDETALIDAIDAVTEGPFGVKVLVATRLSSLSYSAPSSSILLQNFTESDLMKYCRMSGLDALRSSLVIQLLPEYNPLLATLLIEAVRHETKFSLSDLAKRELSADLFQRYVLDRVVAKLSDEFARKIALSAIPLRRVTAAMLSDQNIFINLKNYAYVEPSDIFERVKTEIILFETENDCLVVRPDIRATMSALGMASQDSEFIRVLRAAYQHSVRRLKSARRDPEVITDALYYALMLRAPRGILEEHWDSAAGPELLRHLSEYPPRSIAWLKRKTGRRWHSSDFDAAFPQDADDELFSYSYTAFLTGRMDQVTELVEHLQGNRKRKQPGLQFARAIVALWQGDWYKARIGILQAAPEASSNVMRMEMLAVAIRITALHDDLAGPDLAVTIDRLFADANINDRDSPWWAAYFEVWLSALLDGTAALDRAVARHSKTLSELSPGSRPPLGAREVCELYLLASRVRPGMAARWSSWVDTAQLSTRVVQAMFSFFERLMYPLSNGEHNKGPTSTVSRRELKRLQKRLVATADFQDVAELRTAMFINVSDIVAGQLTAEVTRHFDHLDDEDVYRIGTMFGKSFRPGVKANTFYSSVVRQTLVRAQLNRFVDQLVAARPDDFIDLDHALDRWSTVFDVDRLAL